MRRSLALLVALPASVAVAQSDLLGPLGQSLPQGRPTPWAEITATLLTVSLLLWAAVLRRDE